MAISEQVYTIAEFAAYAQQNPETLLELIDGRIVEKVTSEQHGKLAGWIIHCIILYLQDHPEIHGHWSMDTSYIPADDVHNARRPDVTFRRTDAPVNTQPHLEQLPDFCVEIKSRSNTYDELREKARFYLAQGAKLVWLVYPVRRIVEVYVPDGSSELYLEGEVLSGGDVLPGFALLVSDLFQMGS